MCCTNITDDFVIIIDTPCCKATLAPSNLVVFSRKPLINVVPVVTCRFNTVFFRKIVSRYTISFFKIPYIDEIVNDFFFPFAFFFFLADGFGDSCIHVGLGGEDKGRRKRRLLQHRRKIFLIWWKHYFEWKGWLPADLFPTLRQASCL